MLKICFVAFVVLFACNIHAQTPVLIDPQTGKYLGNANANPYDPNSISNPYGQYGSQYSPDSVNNPYGQYGNPYSPSSINNPYATGSMYNQFDIQ